MSTTYNPSVNPGFGQHAPAGKPRKPWWKKWWVWLIIATAVIAVLILSLFILDKWSSAKLAQMNSDVATRQCEEDITNKAKYPGGVEFVDPVEVSTNDSVDAEVLTYGASGKVDFPNGFGTPVRQVYTCTVLIEGDSGNVRYSSAFTVPDAK